VIVLDLDGPILDGRLRHHECYRRILEAAGATPLPLDRYWALKRERVDRRRLLAESGAEALYDGFLAAWLATIETPELLAFDRVQPGALETLRAWKDAGVPLALVTARRAEDALQDQLSALGLRPLFTVIVATPFAETGEAKASAFAARLGDASSCRGWIGDTEIDVDAARRLGVPSVAVTCGLRTAAYLQSLGPAFLFDDLQAVRAADPLALLPAQ
jgi:phosphoglycolate phosphatase-like HAD superfamily hydrolase